MAYTTIEQSKKLIELGLDPSTADMYYIFDTFIGDIGGVEFGKPEEPEDIPCWSLDALLEVIPKPIKYQGSLCYPELDLFSHKIYYMVGGASYLTIGGIGNLDAAYNMIVWLLTNDYIKGKELK